MPQRKYHVYILSSRSATLYIGVTGDLAQRLEQHRTGRTGSFTTRYNIVKLVYLEEYARIADAIAREKQLKAWRREKKVALIERVNPDWRDLTVE